MELTVYDPGTLIPIGLVEEITSLLWTRRYWSVGDFKLLLPFTDRHAELIRPRRLIGKRGDPELGEIRYVYIRRNAHGMEEIEAQGRFLAGWLDKRVVAAPLVTEMDTQNILHALVDMNAINPANPDRALPDIFHAIDEPYTDSGVIQYSATPYLSLREACQNAAVAAKLGYRIETDIRNKVHFFRVYKGADRTAGQTENMPCVFSPEFDNVLEQQFTHSIENYRTAGYVGGQEREGFPRLIVEVGGGVGLDRDEEFFDAGDIEDKGGNYAAKLISRGESELSNKEESHNFTSKIDLNVTPRYKTDFDVGDRVTCINRRWGVTINSRVTEVVETYQQGKTELNVTFGVSLPTLLEKMSAKAAQHLSFGGGGGGSGGVTPTSVSVTLDPNNPVIPPQSGFASSSRAQATVKDAGGYILNLPVTWSMSPFRPGVSIDADGRIEVSSDATAGTVTILATCRGISGSAVLTLRALTGIVLMLGAPSAVTITSGGRREVSFWAQTAGSYIFESSNRGSLDPTAYTAASGGAVIDDDSAGNQNFRFTQALTAGQVYTFYAGIYSGTASGSYDVTVRKA